MKVAMPIWQGRISPVLDAAGRLLVIEYDGSHEITRNEESIAGQYTPQLASRLTDLEVDVLICGAISQPLFSLVTARNIKVIPWVTGQIEEILDAYQTNRLQTQRFMMPGCGGCRRGRGRTHGEGSGQGRRQRRGQMTGFKRKNRNLEM